MDDEESSGLDKFLMICEYPLTVAREVRISEHVIREALLFIYDLAVLNRQPRCYHIFLHVAHIADCIDSLRGLLLPSPSRIVILSIASVARHVLSEQFRH